MCGVEDEADAGGSREVRKLVNPLRPSQREVDAHELTHLPFRNWCRHCMRGRGKEMAHVKGATDKKLEMHEFSLGYCFPGDTDGVSPLTVLVVRERLTKMLLAAVVPKKGPDMGTARRVTDFIDELGCEHLDVVTKSDREPAIKPLMREVSRLREEQRRQQATGRRLFVVRRWLGFMPRIG